jgi:hypothetical protein
MKQPIRIKSWREAMNVITAEQQAKAFLLGVTIGYGAHMGSRGYYVWTDRYGGGRNLFFDSRDHDGYFDDVDRMLEAVADPEKHGATWR